jgi:hypothetical protein
MPVASTPGVGLEGNRHDALTFEPIWRSWPQRHSVSVVTAAFVTG